MLDGAGADAGEGFPEPSERISEDIGDLDLVFDGLPDRVIVTS